MRLALDAMGGDHAPAAAVQGAARALDAVDDLEVVLFGDPDAIRPLAEEAGIGDVTIESAMDPVGMNESPAEVLRKKPDSPIARGLMATKAGEVDGFVSAGNTGAVVAGGIFVLGRLPQVSRPGIAVTIPRRHGQVVICDVGANVHCKPRQLLHYGYMAWEFARCIHGVEKPRVGLLNIGEEDKKGSPLVQETAALFQDTSLTYVGNVEGHELFGDCVDVVVCEGFVGNSILKVSEGWAGTFISTLKDEMEALQSEGADEGVLKALGRLLTDVRTKLDYAEHGGAPLLGVDGTVVIAHGRSDGRAFAGALRAGAALVRNDLNKRVVEHMAELERREAGA